MTLKTIQENLAPTSIVDLNPEAITPELEAVGPKNASLYVVVSSPSMIEDRTGEGFTSQLTSYFRVNLPSWVKDRTRYNYIIPTYLVDDKRAPRTPTVEELENFGRAHLLEDIAETKPTVVIPIDDVARKFLLPDTGAAANTRGKAFPYNFNGHVCWVCPIMPSDYIKKVANFKGGDIPGKEQKRVWLKDIQRATNLIVEPKAPVVVSLEDFKKDVDILLTPSDIYNALASLDYVDSFAFDIETNTTRPFTSTSRILSFAFAYEKAGIVKAFAFPYEFKQEGTFFFGEDIRKELFTKLQELFHKNHRKIAHNLPFEMEWISHRFGLDILNNLNPNWGDTEVESFVLDERTGVHDLGFISQEYLGFNVKQLSTLDVRKLENFGILEVLTYNAYDAKATKLLDTIMCKIIEAEGLTSIHQEHIRRLPTLVAAQMRGLLVDQTVVKDISASLKTDIDLKLAEILDTKESKAYEELFGQPYLPSSPQRTTKLFKEILGVTPINSKKKESTDKTALKELENEHPIAGMILAYKETTKLRSTYVESLSMDLKEKDRVVFNDGRLHPLFKSTRTVTGRLSSSEPNCFPPYVKTLTKRGWIAFSDVDVSDELAQYDLNTKEITFVKPLSLIKYHFDGDLIHLTSDKHIDITCTQDHNFYTETRSGRIDKTKAIDLKPDQKLPCAGSYVGGYQSYRDSQLILIAALQADGHINDKLTHIDWGFTKSRKIERLKKALDDEKIAYNISVKTKSTQWKKDYISTRITVNQPPEWLRNKKAFGPWILELDKKSFNFLANEIWFWDGCFSRRSMYSSSVESNTWWALALTMLTNRACKVREYNGSSAQTKPNYQIDSLNKNYIWTSNHKKEIIKYEGYVYCAEMPKGTLLVCQNKTAIVVGNCQNFPSRKNKHIRSQIVADPGCVLVACDFAQIEARCIAMASNDAFLFKATLEGYDIHAEWANKVIKDHPKVFKSRGSDFKAFRSQIKNELVFPLFYGSQPDALAMRLGIRGSDAEELFDAFWKQFPGVLDWQRKLKKKYLDKGYVETLTGRRRHAPISDNMIYNSCIQGSASDIVVDAMNRLRDRSIIESKPGLQAVLNIHDDLTFCVKEEQLQDHLEIIAEEMTRCSYPWVTLPLEIEIGVGRDWYNMEHITKVSTKDFK